MNIYNSVNILDMLKYLGEDACKRILSSFSCEINPSIEKFLKENAIDFAKQKIAITYIVFDQDYIVGYYTISNRILFIDKDSVSNSIKKKITKFSQDGTNSQYLALPMPLIAQLGKNLNPNISTKISGKNLLNMALQEVLQIEYLLGGKTVYLECDENEKLLDFYSSQGFSRVNKRVTKSGESLIQMFKILN